MLKKIFMISVGAALAATCGVALAQTPNIGTAASSGMGIAMPACPAFNRSLSFGTRGNDVSILQGYLNAKGYLSVSPTGYFGPLTQAAVAKWQAQGGVVSMGGIGSGTFGPLSRAYFSRSCGNAGGSGQATVFSADPTSGIAPLTVRFISSAPQGSDVGKLVDFGDSATGTLGYVPVCSNCNAMGVVSHTYNATGTYTATLFSNGPCACPLGAVCNCPANIILGTATVTVSAGGDIASTTSNIQQLNAPGSVLLGVGDIAEIRNASFYFTLASAAASTATIDITPVGCWNSFPSDAEPMIRCMIAIVPTPPQTLSIGQAYAFGAHTITLTNISNGTSTFSVE